MAQANKGGGEPVRRDALCAVQLLHERRAGPGLQSRANPSDDLGARAPLAFRTRAGRMCPTARSDPCAGESADSC